MNLLRKPVSVHDWKEALGRFYGVVCVDIFQDDNAPFVVACIVHGGDESAIRDFIECSKPQQMMWAVSVRSARWYHHVLRFIRHWTM